MLFRINWPNISKNFPPETRQLVTQAVDRSRGSINPYSPIFKPHKEVILGHCNRVGCGTKLCDKICGDLEDQYTSVCPSNGNPSFSTEEAESKEIFQINESNYSGQNKPQYVVWYKNGVPTNPNEITVNRRVTAWLSKSGSSKKIFVKYTQASNEKTRNSKDSMEKIDPKEKRFLNNKEKVFSKTLRENKVEETEENTSSE
jgi:hypothetical protein